MQKITSRASMDCNKVSRPVKRRGEPRSIMNDNAIKHVVSCRECSLNALCIPHGLSMSEIDEISMV